MERRSDPAISDERPAGRGANFPARAPPPRMNRHKEPIHVTIPGSPADPRDDRSIPGIVIHRSPPLHPDDVWIVDGLRITSPSRTLIDCAEDCDADELRAMFVAAAARGLLDPAALRAARARVEWRPSLAMFDAVMAEFCGGG